MDGMEDIKKILERMIAKRPRNTATSESRYKCDKCKDVTFIFKEDESGYERTYPCTCREQVLNNLRVEKSGLKNEFATKKLETFKARTEKQSKIYELAKRYVSDDSNNWLFLGGQSGFGKTHISTAVCGELIKSKPLLYMTWVSDAKKLKFMKDDLEYKRTIERFQNVKVLYIDDLFKIKNGGIVSDADVRLAFEIIDFRIKNDLKTIISSEMTISQLIEIDEALAGRIVEKCGKYAVSIGKDAKENQRLVGALQL